MSVVWKGKNRYEATRIRCVQYHFIFYNGKVPGSYYVYGWIHPVSQRDTSWKSGNIFHRPEAHVVAVLQGRCTASEKSDSYHTN